MKCIPRVEESGSREMYDFLSAFGENWLAIRQICTLYTPKGCRNIIFKHKKNPIPIPFARVTNKPNIHKRK